jgi:hypothetical protein
LWNHSFYLFGISRFCTIPLYRHLWIRKIYIFRTLHFCAIFTFSGSHIS